MPADRGRYPPPAVASSRVPGFQAAPLVVAMEAILAVCPLVVEMEAVAEGPCEGP